MISSSDWQLSRKRLTINKDMRAVTFQMCVCVCVCVWFFFFFFFFLVLVNPPDPFPGKAYRGWDSLLFTCFWSAAGGILPYACKM